MPKNFPGKDNPSVLERFMAWLGEDITSASRIKRNLFLLVLIGLLSLLPITLQSQTARFWAPFLALLIALFFLVTLGGVSFISTWQSVLQKGEKVSLFGKSIALAKFFNTKGERSFLWQALTRLGLLFPALLFFLFWTFLYITAWTFDPGVCVADPAITCQASFAGISENPTLGDFLYFAVNMAFANPVPDILATNRLTHTLVTLEVISGIALATLYAGAFFGFSKIDGGRNG